MASLACLLLLLFGCTTHSLPTITHQAQIHNNEYHITLTMDIPSSEWVYKEQLTFATDHPDITVQTWTSNPSALNKYDPVFQQNKLVYEGTVTFTVTLQRTSEQPLPASLYVTYYSNTMEGPKTVIIPLQPEEQPQPSATPQEVTASLEEKKVPCEHPPVSQKPEKKSLTGYITALVQTTNSLSIRILLVFLLGILLSLTPCIYPMVPITAGILQAQGSTSLVRNIVLSCAYTVGVATTFAVFGLLASCLGPLCGRLLMDPFFIFGLIVVLLYFALSLFGLYDITLPTKFFPAAKSAKHGGSVWSTFLFGAASGTIASPCVSPGLALLLSIVATLGSTFLGFILLFAFGVGLSTPLLIVGACSSSLSLLPRAGLWMIEIKKLFGFIMIGMCFYYASFVVTPSVLAWVFSCFLASVGAYYIYTANTLHQKKWRLLNYTVGSMCIALTVVCVFHAYRSTHSVHDVSIEPDIIWLSDYEQARKQALENKKNLFIDFWATFCPVCLDINNNLFKRPALVDVLKQFTLLKVDGSLHTAEPYATLKEKFRVAGMPSFLIVDPVTQKVLTCWGSEINGWAEEDLICMLKQYI